MIERANDVCRYMEMDGWIIAAACERARREREREKLLCDRALADRFHTSSPKQHLRML